MNTKALAAVGAALALSALFVQASPLGTAFTYQGKLTDGGNPANGSYDLRFALFDAATDGTQIGSTLTNSPLGVTNGLFTITLDFGSGVFNGDVRWLEIGVRPGASTGGFTNLSPRTAITAVPYAILAGNASNLLGVLPVAQLSGAVGNSQLANSSIAVNAGTGLSGGGVVALGGSTTLSNSGVLTVTGNPDMVVANINGNVVLGTTGTDANTPAKLVRRDGSGNFSAGSVSLAGSLNLPTTTSSVGIINSGGNRLIHTFGSQNFFAGTIAGNFAVGGYGNVGVGYAALLRDTAGSANTANGYAALAANTTGQDNTASGAGALSVNATGQANTASGSQALYNHTNGSYNIALGYQAGYQLTTGSSNIYIANYGTASESGTIRIGTSGTQTNTYVAGIYGRSLANGVPVYVDSTGALGAASSLPVALQNGTNTFSGTNTFAGVVIVTNPANQLGGIFSGTLSGNVGSFNATNITATNIVAATYNGGYIYGSYLAGNGSGLTSLNANALSGTVPSGSLAGTYPLIVSFTNSGNSFYGHFTGSGDGLFNLIANNLSGRVPDLCLGGNYPNTVTFGNVGNSFNGSFYGGNVSGSGYGLYNLNADNLASGSVPDARLGANLARLDRGATFTGTVTTSADLVAARVQVGTNHVMLTPDFASIAGGDGNSIYAAATNAVIGGGHANAIGVIGPGCTMTTIAGGEHNTITNATAGMIPGGYGNIVGGSYSFAAGRFAQALHVGAFVWGDSLDQPIASTANNQFIARANGGVRFTTGSGGANQTVAWTPGSGSWTFSSDRELKENFRPVDGREVLNKIAQLPVSEWNFKGYAQRHIGPVAQDWHAFFPLNDNQTTLNEADLHGVTLAAIQGLNQKVEAKDAEIQQLKARLEKLERLLVVKNGGTE